MLKKEALNFPKSLVIETCTIKIKWINKDLLKEE